MALSLPPAQVAEATEEATGKRPGLQGLIPGGVWLGGTEAPF